MFLESFTMNLKHMKTEEHPLLSIHKTENFSVNVLRSSV